MKIPLCDNCNKKHKEIIEAYLLKSVSILSSAALVFLSGMFFSAHIDPQKAIAVSCIGSLLAAYVYIFASWRV